MLQIIRGKLVIFLITLCLFVVYLGFDNNSNSDIVFYGHKTPRALRYIFLKKILFIK
ncbi:dCTP deaminase [Escherichia coli]|uniref:dCTP deaminase n=1 Tax=Escherichia coli TaxID=562 RepID=A0A377CVY4_ECOLX|nr:dCTP deaminase [Escherichia coli]